MHVCSHICRTGQLCDDSDRIQGNWSLFSKEGSATGIVTLEVFLYTVLSLYFLPIALTGTLGPPLSFSLQCASRVPALSAST